jgi:hypothetical protein
MLRRVLLLLLLSLTGMWAADVLTRERTALSDTTELVLEHPASFQFTKVREVVDAFRPALRLRLVNAQGSNNIVFKIFAARIMGDGPQTQAELDVAVQKMGEVYVTASMEKTNEVQHLKLPQTGGWGAYSVFTDASLIHVVNPPADQYRVITVGAVRLGDYLFTIRGGSNDKDSPDYQALIGILNSLRVESHPPDPDYEPQL